MFHVERNPLFYQDFRRAGASGKVKFRFDCVTSARIRAKATNVKSFLRVRAKFFPKRVVFVPDPVPTLVVYAQTV